MKSSFLHISLLLFISAAARGVDLRITALDACVVNDSLCFSVRMDGVISDKMEGIILSGLPAMVELEVVLTDMSNRRKKRERIALKISHDVWRDVFTIECRNQSRNFSSLDSLKKAVHHLQRVALFPLKSLAQGNRHMLAVRAEIAGISEMQNDKLKNWVIYSTETEEKHTSERRNTGFRFSLSRLIGSLLIKERDSQNRTDWFQSEPFIPGDNR